MVQWSLTILVIKNTIVIFQEKLYHLYVVDLTNINTSFDFITFTAGELGIDKNPLSWETLEKKYHSKIHKGRYSPEHCIARQRVAILIPIRDRESHLRVFLNHIHPILMRQQLEYGIYVVEQVKHTVTKQIHTHIR